jgi:spore coat protein U-like protein
MPLAAFVMTVPLRTLVRLAALAFAAWPVAQAQAASTTVKVSVNAVKALTLAAKQDLDFGQILLSGGSDTSTVSMDLAGVVSCGDGLTCSGVPRPAIMNVAGSNGQVVRIFVAPSDLINATDGSKLRFTPVAPASVTLTNSGQPGKDFNVGGSIDIPATTTDGLYSGNIEVTVDYQ